jgi:uncharacterized membrane protein YidH (DUF202 family)
MERYDVPFEDVDKMTLEDYENFVDLFVDVIGNLSTGMYENIQKKVKYKPKSKPNPDPGPNPGSKTNPEPNSGPNSGPKTNKYIIDRDNPRKASSIKVWNGKEIIGAFVEFLENVKTTMKTEMKERINKSEQIIICLLDNKKEEILTEINKLKEKLDSELVNKKTLHEAANNALVTTTKNVTEVKIDEEAAKAAEEAAKAAKEAAKAAKEAEEVKMLLVAKLVDKTLTCDVDMLDAGKLQILNFATMIKSGVSQMISFLQKHRPDIIKTISEGLSEGLPKKLITASIGGAPKKKKSTVVHEEVIDSDDEEIEVTPKVVNKKKQAKENKTLVSIQFFLHIAVVCCMLGGMFVRQDDKGRLRIMSSHLFTDIEFVKAEYERALVTCTNPIKMAFASFGQKLFCEIIGRWIQGINHLAMQPKENIFLTFVTGGTVLAGFAKFWEIIRPIAKLTTKGYFMIISILAYILMYFGIIVLAALKFAYIDTLSVKAYQAIMNKVSKKVARKAIIMNPDSDDTPTNAAELFDEERSDDIDDCDDDEETKCAAKAIGKHTDTVVNKIFDFKMKLTENARTFLEETINTGKIAKETVKEDEELERIARVLLSLKTGKPLPAPHGGRGRVMKKKASAASKKRRSPSPVKKQKAKSTAAKTAGKTVAKAPSRRASAAKRA